MQVIQFVDTSVLLEILNVPGHSGRHEEILAEMDRRMAAKISFVLPVTTIIETGNHIAQSTGDRRGAAKRFVKALEAARDKQPPWTIRDVRWDSDFLESFVGGGSTGSDLLTHLSNTTLGSGDLAILVERDQFAKGVAARVEIWSLDLQLAAFSGDVP